MMIAVLAGVVFGGLQFSILKMATELGISKAVMGSMVSVCFGAMTISPIISGSIADRKGKKPVLICTLLTLMLGSILCILTSSTAALFVALAVAGLGIGSVESMMIAAMADYDLSKAGKNTNITEGVLSIGCCMTPLVLDFAAVQYGFGWRLLYYICIAGALICAGLTLFTRFPESSPDELPAETEGKGDIVSIIRDKVAAALIICVFIYIFMENGVTYFADTFMALDLGRADLSAMVLALFWAAMAVSRFISAALFAYEKYITMWGYFASAVLLTALFFLHQVPVVISIFFMIGIFYAPLWPFLAGRLNSRFPGNTGTVSGIVLAVGGAGGMLSPYVMGVCADNWRVSGGFLIVAATAVCGFLLVGRANALEKSEARKDKEITG